MFPKKIAIPGDVFDLRIGSKSRRFIFMSRPAGRKNTTLSFTPQIYYYKILQNHTTVCTGVKFNPRVRHANRRILRGFSRFNNTQIIHDSTQRIQSAHLQKQNIKLFKRNAYDSFPSASDTVPRVSNRGTHDLPSYTPLYTPFSTRQFHPKNMIN